MDPGTNVIPEQHAASEADPASSPGGRFPLRTYIRVVGAVALAAVVHLVLAGLIPRGTIVLLLAIVVVTTALARHVGPVLLAAVLAGVMTTWYSTPSSAGVLPLGAAAVWIPAFVLLGVVTLRVARPASVARADADAAARESRAAEAARAALMRLMIDSVRDYAIFRLDANGHIATWNAGAERTIGYTEAEIVGKHFSVFYPQEERARGLPQRQLRQALLEGRAEDEGWRVRRDGSRYWVNAVVTPIYEEGELRGFAKVTRDLTSRRASEALLSSILASATDGIIGIDQGGIIRSANRAAEQMFGYSAVQLIGRNVSMLMPEPYRTEHDTYLVNYTNTGIARIIGVGRQLPGLRSDGSTFPLDLTVSEFALDDQRYFTGVLRDLTVQRALEEQLQQANKMQAIGQLAGGIAHDFNNLLTIIAGHTEMLLANQQHAPVAAEELREIREAALRAASLTRQLLAFSRRAVLEPKVLDLNAVVQDTERILRRVIRENVQLVTQLTPDLNPVNVDGGQMGQVLINLAVNARDAMPNGGTLTITTGNVDLGSHYTLLHPDAREGPHVLLTVSDTGVGMTPEVRSRIFEPFFTTKQAGAGTGLGLSLVYGIVKQSGGHIDVYSELEHGTVFKIYLPAALRRARPPAPPLRERDAYHGSETILVVEDEEQVRRLAVLALRRHGYTVLEAANGADALERIRGHSGRVDLVVTDVVMPGMGGRQLMEALRAEYPGLRALYVSGYTDDEVLLHGVRRAEVEFLGKPYTPTELAARVRQILDGLPAHGQLSSP